MAEQPYTDKQSKEAEEFTDIKRMLTMNTRRVRNIMRTLGPLMASMENLVEIQERFKLMLYEPRLLFNYRKDWAAFLIALRMYNKYKREKVNGDEAKKSIQQVRLYDREFADDIENILPDVGDNFAIFSELLNEIKKGRQYFVAYISTNSAELIEKAKAMKDKDPKLSKQLVGLFTAISGHEAEALSKCEADCEHWIYYADHAGYDIGLFINRLNLFLTGWMQNNERIGGLYKDFNDSDLRSRMINNASVKNLWFFMHQIEYLKRLIAMCFKAYQSGDWNNGFYGKKGFWTDFDKYAKAFEKVYGNSDFKNELIAIERKTENELPQFWGGVWERSPVQDANELQQRRIKFIVMDGALYIPKQEGVLTRMLDRFYERKYQIERVIHPAAAALMKIFEDRKNELMAARNQKMRDLIKLLLGMFGVPQLRKFRKLLRKKKKKLMRELINDTSELASKSTGPLSQYHTISDEQERVLGRMTAEYIAQVTKELVARRNQEIVYADRQLATESFLKRDEDITEFTLTGIAEKRAAEFQFEKIKHETLWHLTEDDFQYMQRLIPRIKAIIRRLAEVYEFIKSKMEQMYTIKAEALGMMELDIEQRKNRGYELSYVREMLNRLI